MSTEVSRTVHGSNSFGQVVVICKQSADGTTYEVRNGVRTVDSGLSKTKADALAKALS
jgi:hypothetical protein